MKLFVNKLIKLIKSTFPSYTYQIGIIFRDNKILLSKSRLDHSHKQVELFQFKPQKKGRTYLYSIFENLALFLDEFEPSFFADSKVSFCLPFFQTFVESHQIPDLSLKERKKILLKLAKPDEFEWGYEQFGAIIKHNKAFLDIRLLKAKKSVVQAYLDVFDHKNIPVNTATCEPIVMQHVLKTGQFKNIEDAFIIADLQDGFLKLYVVVALQVMFYRSIPYGFTNIVKKLCKTKEILDIDEDKAEELLEKHNIITAKNNYIENTPVENIFKTISPVLETMSLEIQKTINFYQKQLRIYKNQSEDSLHISQLCLMGNFNQLHSSVEYFEKKTNLKTLYFHYNNDLTQQQDKQKSYPENFCWSLATSLSNNTTTPLNFVSSTRYNSQRLPAFVFLISLSFGLFLSLSIFVYFSLSVYKLHLEHSVKTFQKQKTSLETELKNTAKREQVSASIKKQINQINQNKINPEVLIYALSQLDYQDIFIESLLIEDNIVNIKAQVKNQQSSLVKFDYINKLNSLNILEQLNFKLNIHNLQQSNNMLKTSEQNPGLLIQAILKPVQQQPKHYATLIPPQNLSIPPDALSKSKRVKLQNTAELKKSFAKNTKPSNSILKNTEYSFKKAAHQSEASLQKKPPTIQDTETLHYHTIKKGESLSKLAMIYYNNLHRWRDIYELNKTSLKNKHVVFPGQTIIIPSIQVLQQNQDTLKTTVSQHIALKKSLRPAKNIKLTHSLNHQHLNAGEFTPSKEINTNSKETVIIASSNQIQHKMKLQLETLSTQSYLKSTTFSTSLIDLNKSKNNTFDQFQKKDSNDQQNLK